VLCGAPSGSFGIVCVCRVWHVARLLSYIHSTQSHASSAVNPVRFASVSNESHSSWRGFYNGLIILLPGSVVKPESPELWSVGWELSCFLWSGARRSRSEARIWPGYWQRLFGIRIACTVYATANVLLNSLSRFVPDATGFSRTEASRREASTADAHRG